MKVFFPYTLFLIIIIFASCFSKKASDLSFSEKKGYYIVSVQNTIKGKTNAVNFYCLLNTTKKEMKKIIETSYSSRYEVYNILCNTYNAKCILAYGEKYWSNSCIKGRFSYSISSSEDSIFNQKTLQKLKTNSNYLYKDLIIGNYNTLDIGIKVGFSKADSLEYCKILDRGNCDLPSDTLIILKRGFSMMLPKL